MQSMHGNNVIKNRWLVAQCLTLGLFVVTTSATAFSQTTPRDVLERFCELPRASW